MKDVKITKLEIQLTDDKISLSTADAKKLYEALADLFASKRVEHIYHDYWTYRPYPYLGSGGYSLQGGISHLSQAMCGAPSGQQNVCVSGSTLQMAVGS